MPDRPPVKFTARHVGRSTIQEIDMTDAPERIWAVCAPGAGWADGLGMWSPEDAGPGSVAFIRADLVHSLNAPHHEFYGSSRNGCRECGCGKDHPVHDSGKETQE